MLPRKFNTFIKLPKIDAMNRMKQFNRIMTTQIHFD